MIYGISGKGKIGIGYHTPKNSLLNPKSKKNVKMPREMRSHSTYGHSHYLYSAHQPWVDKNFLEN